MCTYILFSLEAFPPEIFCTLNWPSSVFSSRSCFWRSSFDLPHNWTVLILVVFDCSTPPPPPKSALHAFLQKIQSFHSIFYHLVRGFICLLALQQELCGAVSFTCALSTRRGLRNILGCAVVPTLIVVKR